MKRYSANYIFPVTGEPIKNGIIVVTDNGTIAEIIDPKGASLELPSMEYHSGILIPGLVNTHCHLELSHLKGVLTPHKGLAHFVGEVKQTRHASSEEIIAAAKSADRQMFLQGTAAVGDVCNGDATSAIKASSKIRYHSFFEVLGLATDGLPSKLKDLQATFDNLRLASKASYAPHSVYSLSAAMWEVLQPCWHQQFTSVHYMESKEEFTLLNQRKGELAQLFSSWGLPFSQPSAAHFDIVNQFMCNAASVLFVHNTYATPADIDRLRAAFTKMFLAICPTSNLFIEKRLPALDVLLRNVDVVTLGTDSFASSNSLSVFQQMITLSEHYPEIPFATVLAWATHNGAKALGFDDVLGSFDVGKQPGINLIQGFDFAAQTLRPTATLTRLL